VRGFATHDFLGKIPPGKLDFGKRAFTEEFSLAPSVVAAGNRFAGELFVLVVKR
jgi:hypothetical protein